MEGFQSELGEFINRKTNSWRALYLLCLSQGCNINFPTLLAVKAEETFCEFRAFLPACVTHTWSPVWGRSRPPRGAGEDGVDTVGLWRRTQCWGVKELENLNSSDESSRWAAWEKKSTYATGVKALRLSHGVNLRQTGHTNYPVVF